MKIQGKNWYIIPPTQKELELAYNSSFYHSNERECLICKIKFKHGKGSKCGLHKIFALCPICNKMHEINFDNISGTQAANLYEKIINNDEIFNCCSLECRQKLIYKNQKENKTGFCSKEAIIKKNSYENNCIRQQNALKRGTQAGASNVQKQLKLGLHPSQNLELQSRKVLLMNLKRLGFNVKLEDINQQKYIELFNKTGIQIDSKIVKYEESHKYDNICGAIGLMGVFNGDGLSYALTAGKSIDLGSEIRRFYRILSQPYKQDMNYEYGRWYKITHDYKNFEIIILCKNVSEQEALLTEAAWAYKNDANFKYKIINKEKVQIEGTHGYWL